ncbi:hypothetical protein FKM82_014757 [Ascaphus truei]
MRRHLMLFLVHGPSPCLCQGVLVTQDTKLLLVREGGSVNISCHHDDDTYLNMFWYQQKPAEGLKLMVWSTGANEEATMEVGYKVRWNLTRPETKKSSLYLAQAETGDAAVYFCAASIHRRRYQSSSQPKTYSVPDRGRRYRGTPPGAAQELP